MILLTIALILSIICTAIAGVIAWNSMKKNFELQDKHKEYNRVHTMMLDILEEDTQFMKVELIKRLSLEIPETRMINSSILKFQNTLEVVKATLKEYKMLED